MTLTDKQYIDRLQAVILLRQQGYYDPAITVIKDLLRLRPDESSLWHQMGQIATCLGEAHEAVNHFGQAVYLLKKHGALQTHAAQFQASSLGYGQSLMRLGRFAEAWPYFESGRLHVSWSPWPTTEYWDGTTEALPPSLLVQAEGGYGDIFMFMRWLPLLKTRFGIGRVGLMIFKGMYDFCDWHALGVDEVYRTDIDRIPFGRWQYSTSIMSLAAAFQINSWSDISAVEGGGFAATLAVSTLAGAAALPKSPFRLGFCWRAEENSSPIKTKSLEPEVAADIVRLLCESDALPGEMGIFSLSPERKDLYVTHQPFQQPPGLIYEPDAMQTWKGTALYLYSMDFVLTVDTAVGHLCGLLGVPSLVLVPRGGCWRFGTEDNTLHPWYGAHTSLYRQPKVLEWDAADIAAATIRGIGQLDAATV